MVAPGVPTTIVTLVGPARGYQNAVESIAIFSREATFLTQRGAFVSSSSNPLGAPLPVVTKSDGTVMTIDVDYAFVADTEDGGGQSNTRYAIKRLSTNSSDPTDPTQPSPHGIADGDLVTVSYMYADSSYYSPQEFDDPALVARRYGDALSTDPNAATDVLSPLTLAAQIAFTNGAGSVLCCPIDQTNNAVALRDQFKNAYTKLLSDYRVTMLVPLLAGVQESAPSSNAPTLTAFINDLRDHCVTSANQGYGRIGLVGAPRGYEDTTDFTVVATAVKSKRVLLSYPARLSFLNGAANRIVDADSFYAAAAEAGVLASNPVPRGLTKKSISGFTGLPASVFQKMSKSYKDSLSRNGVAVLEVTRANELNCRHGVSTDMSSDITREISVTRIADTLYAAIQTGMDAAGLIGEPIDLEMTTRVKAAITGILEQQVTQRVIVSYGNLAVRQQTYPTGNPTVIEVQFSYVPALPLNYITVSFSIDLSSGATTLGNETQPVTTG
jgi:hypothetical protein